MNNPMSSPPKKFWQWEWAPEPTQAHKAWSVVLGILLPILILFIWLVTFIGSPCSYTVPLNLNVTFVLVAMGIGVLTMSSWLLTGCYVESGAEVYAGIFFTVTVALGSVVWILFGLTIASLNVIGFFFTSLPLGIMFIYFRNGVIAWQLTYQQAQPTPKVALLLTGVMVVWGLTALVQWQYMVNLTKNINQYVVACARVYDD